MGSIRRAPRTRRWKARYRDPDGRQRTKTFDTKAEAGAFLSLAEADMRRGDWVDPRRGEVVFADYADGWLSGVSHLRDGTMANVRSRLRRHILPAFGDRAMASITPADVRAWLAELTPQGLSASTVVATYRLFARVMQTAEIDGVIARTPCVGIRLPRETGHQEMHFLDPSQIATLTDIVGPRYRVLIFTAAYTGLRWGELAGLGRRRLDLAVGTVRVVEALTEVNGRLTLGPTKTGAHRTVSLPPFLIEMLSEHVDEYASTEGFVFTAAEGGPLRRNFYRRTFKPAVPAAGLPPDLRSTTSATPVPRFSSPKAPTRRRSRNASATRPSASRSTGTATCSPPWTVVFEMASNGPTGTRERPRLHELAALECADVILREREPFAVETVVGEPLVPVALDADWIVGLDLVNLRRPLGKLDRQLVLAAPN
jgi:integrase